MRPVVVYDPFSPEVMADPYPIYRELRAGDRAHPLPQYDAVALPRFADVWEVSRDRERFSIVEGPVSRRDALLVPNPGPPPPGPTDPVPSFSMTDPPVHTALRGAQAPAFTPATVRRSEDAVRAHARSLLDRLVPTGGFDVVRDYAAPVAARATCTALGLAELDEERVVDLVNTAARRDGLRPGMSDTGRAAMGELAGMVVGCLDATGSTDAPLLAALAAVEVAGRRLTVDEVVTQVTTTLVGGVESLPKVVGGGVRALAAAPDQRRLLVGEPDRVPAAFEECLRLFVPLQFGTRTLVVDADVGGVALRAGQRVILLYACANRDDTEFADAEHFDVTRRITRHLGFGHGLHFCIGAHAARQQGVVLLTELLARIPEWDVDEAGVVSPPSEFQQGSTAVPIRFMPTG